MGRISSPFVAVTAVAAMTMLAGHANAQCLGTWVQGPLPPPPSSVSNGAAYAMAVFNGRAIAGGLFSAPGSTTIALLGWDGVTVSGFGSGVGPNNTVRALKAYSSGVTTKVLVVGGDFTMVDSIGANHVASYTLSNQIGAGWAAMGNGFDGTVRAIERLGSTVYAAGDFLHSGGTTLHHIAKFSAGSWQPLAGSDLNGTVNVLKVYNGSLYAGGSFTSANGQDSGGLARWDGSAWQVVGGHFGGTVNALEVYNGLLIIGGLYQGLPGAPNLAAFDGTNYGSLSGAGTDAAIDSLAVGSDGNLYIGGHFNTIGITSASRVARYDGTFFRSLGNGADGPVLALSSFHNEVQVGGNFNHVQVTMLDIGWARFSVDSLPWIVTSPTSSHAFCSGSNDALSFTVAPGYSDFSYQWQHNNVNIGPGVTPWGTDIEIVDGQIAFVPLHQPDSGSYTCVVSNGCTSTTTSPVSIIVNSADFNGDGDVGTDADIEAFFACIAGNCCATCGSADFNGDGDVGTDADIESFFSVLAGGPC